MRRLSTQISVGFGDDLTDEQRARIWFEISTIPGWDAVPPAIDWSPDTNAAVITVGVLTDAPPPYDLSATRGLVDRAIRAVLNTPTGLSVRYWLGQADVVTDLGEWPLE